MLTFDADTAAILDTGYKGADITRRRRASFDVLAPRPAETIIDIGCGNGMLTVELARAVGPAGRVIGVDPSDDMRALAEARCDGFAQVSVQPGTAEALPVADGAADAAVSLQVFEYLPDLDTAVAAAMRAVRAGGRLVLADMHFDSVLWHSDDPARMARMIASWDRHCAHRDAPAKLSGILTAQGHVVEELVPVTLSDRVLKPDGMAMTMMHLMRHYALANAHLPKAEVDAWFAEQQDLAHAGRFFFAITQFVLRARKPG